MRTRRWALTGGLVAAVILAVTYFTLFGKKDTTSLLRYSDPEITARGAKIYAANCASCHGDDLQGQPNWQTPNPDGMLPAPPHDSTGHTWHHADELLFRITKYGVGAAAGLTDHKSAMPTYETILSDDEIIAALSWIKSKWPKDLQAQHNRLNAEFARRKGK